MKLKKPISVVFLALVALLFTGVATQAAEPKSGRALEKRRVIAKKDKKKAEALSSEKAGLESEQKPKSEKNQSSDKGGLKIDAAAEKERLAEKVLDPSRFFGQAMIGYAAAKAAPEIMNKLFCYCGCDITDSHISLLDCFTSIHGVDCHICQEEAVVALKLNRDGTSVGDIQKIVDEKYAEHYPFEEDSPTYKNYKATRLYAVKGKIDSKSAKAPAVKFGEGTAGPAAPDDDKKWVPKLKPGKQVNSQCCSGDDKKDGK